MILALVFGLFGDPSVLVEKYYVRITDPAEMRGWTEIDRARGYSGRLNVISQENEIYRWFDWLTEPLTPAEAASPPAAAPGPGGDIAP